MGILNVNVKELKKQFALRQEKFLAVAQQTEIHLGFPGIEKIDFKVLEQLAAKMALAEGEVGIGTLGEDDEHCAILCIGAENGMHLIIAQDDSVSFTQSSFTQDKVVEGLFTKVILQDGASEELKALLTALNVTPTTRAELAAAAAQVDEVAATTKLTVDVGAAPAPEMSFKDKIAAITSPRRPLGGVKAEEAAASPTLPVTATASKTVAVMTDPNVSDLAGLEGAGSVIVIRGGNVETPKS